MKYFMVVLHDTIEMRVAGPYYQSNHWYQFRSFIGHVHEVVMVF